MFRRITISAAILAAAITGVSALPADAATHGYACTKSQRNHYRTINIISLSDKLVVTRANHARTKFCIDIVPL